LNLLTGCKPVPFLAEDFGDLSAAFAPVFVDSSLNELDIDFGDGPVSDGDG